MCDEFGMDENRLRRILLEHEEQHNSVNAGLNGDLSDEGGRKLAKMQLALDLLKLASDQTKESSSEALRLEGVLPSNEEVSRFHSQRPYRLIRRLGQGGFGVVFLAFDEHLNRNVAVKLPRPDIFLTRSIVRRFLREAQNVAKLDHPNIVPVLGIDDSAEMPSIIYHFCDGPTLAEWLKKLDGPANPVIVATIGYVLAEAVQHAHSRGILHRDLKPSNILLEPSTNRNSPDSFHDGQAAWTPRIIDFGISKATEEDGGYTATHGIIGTPEYMSPEQLAGRTKDVGTHSDVYSLGVVLYELLCKARPFAERSVVDLLMKMRSSPPAPVRKCRGDVSRDLESIVMRCLSHNASQRYSTASELAADLRSFLQRKPVSARSQSRLQRLHSWALRQPVIASLVAACLLLALFGTITTSLYIAHINSLVNELLTTNVELEQERDRADKEAKLATKNAQELRLQLYAADMAAASQALREGDITRYHSLMERQIPRSGPDSRDLAWEYLWWKGHRKHQTIAVSDSALYAFSFSHDLKHAAVCGKDGIVRLFDLNTKLESSAWDAKQSELNCATFSDDDRHIATAGDDGTVCVWEASTGKLAQQFQAHAGRVYKVLFVSDDTLVTCGNEPTIRLWKWATGAPVGVLEGHAKSVQSIALSGDQQRLASASDDGTTRVWDVDKIRLAWQSTDVHSRNVDVDFSPVRSWLFSADVTGVVRRMNTAGDSVSVGEIADLTDNCESLATTPDGQRVAVASRDGNIKIIDLDAQGNPRATSDGSVWDWAAHRGRVFDLQFSSDGSHLHSVGEDGAWKIWPLLEKLSKAELDVRDLIDPSIRFQISLDPLTDDACVFAAGTTLFKWDILSDEVDRIAEMDKPVSRIVADGRRELVLTGHYGGHVYAGSLKSKHLEKLWEYAWPGRADHVTGLTLNNMLGKVATFIEGADRVRLLDLQDGREVGCLTLPRGTGGENIGGISFSPDGNWLAAALDQEIVVWNMRDGTSKRLSGHENTVLTIRFHPESQLLASGSDDRVIRIWELEAGASIAELRHHKDGITSLLFSPDGRTLLSTDQAGSRAVWHSATGKLLYELESSGFNSFFSNSWIGSNVFWNSNHVLIRAGRFGDARASGNLR